MSMKWLALALKFLVSGFLIWFLARGIDFDEAGRRLAEIDRGLLVAALLVLILSIGLCGGYWANTSC